MKNLRKDSYYCQTCQAIHRPGENASDLSSEPQTLRELAHNTASPDDQANAEPLESKLREFIKDHKYDHQDEMVAALKKLIAQEANKARIEEVRALNRQASSAGLTGLLKWYIEDRITQLRDLTAQKESK